jgi:hypothetical protein
MAKRIQALSCFAVVMSFAAVAAVDTTSIEEVRTQSIQSNTPPDAAAIQVIDEFWQKNIDTLMLAEDTVEIIAVRDELVKQKGDKDLSFYASAYVKAADKHLKSALDTVDKWTENDKRIRVERNLLILLAQLSHIDLADLAMTRLDDPDSMVRYWAVRALTNRAIIAQLKDVADDEKKTSQIIAALDDAVQKNNDPRSWAMIGNFAVGLQTAASQKLLLSLADKRIDTYMQWTVTDEAADAAILKSIGALVQATTSPAVKQEQLSRLGQLYSCVIQRYMMGKNLPDTSKDQLATVIAEVEDAVILKILPGWTVKFKNDLARNLSIDKDYELLFGSGTRPGDLASRLNFNFGKDDTGKAMLIPKPLPAAPTQPAPKS